ncbi:MAG: hypothetical protein D4S01_09570 [Dehalococcoidia bacterium]|nr:MAG: hypothetical protein D4S01_09570 [Dehalococcoidia bacterium]
MANAALNPDSCQCILERV